MITSDQRPTLMHLVYMLVTIFHFVLFVVWFPKSIISLHFPKAYSLIVDWCICGRIWPFSWLIDDVALSLAMLIAINWQRCWVYTTSELPCLNTEFNVSSTDHIGSRHFPPHLTYDAYTQKVLSLISEKYWVIFK